MTSGFVNESGRNIVFAGIITSILGLVLFNENFLSNLLFYGVGVGALVFTALEIQSYFVLRNTEYRFKQDEIEFYEGWINITQKNVAFDRVTDISFDKPITQRTFGTGNININTAGSNTHKIKIKYVKQPERVYNELRGIVWDERA